MNVVEGDAGDWGCVSRLASWTLVAVILLDDDAEFFDVLEGDVLVCDIGHGGGGGVVVGLYANTVLGVADGAVVDVGTGDDLAGLDGTDGDSVTAGTDIVHEGDVGSRVESQAIILVVNNRVLNLDVSRARNSESIRVVTAALASTNISALDVSGDLVASRVGL